MGNLAEAHKLHESPESVSGSFKAYQAIKDAFHLPDNVKIYYPASADDDTVSKSFPKGEIWHLDIDELALKRLEKKTHNSKHHTVAKSALEYEPSAEVDVVVLQNHHIPEKNLGDVPKIITEKLKTGGYLIVSRWGNANDAENIVLIPNFELVGYIDNENPEKVNTNVTKIKEDLKAKKKKDAKEEYGMKDISVHAGKIFIFKKTGVGEIVPKENRLLDFKHGEHHEIHHSHEKIHHVQKSIWSKIWGVIKGIFTNPSH